MAIIIDEFGGTEIWDEHDVVGERGHEDNI